jgi:Spy/CpxP family protein refolding chaperone
MDLLIQASPDSLQLNNLAQQMGQQQIEMENKLSEHYAKLSAVCNTEQRVKLGEVFKKMMEKRGGSKGGKGRGRKHSKDIE